MRTFTQLHEIIINAKNFHLNIAEFYEQFLDVTRDNRAELLLKHMYEHEMRMANNLRNYSVINQAKIMKTWLQYTHEESPAEVLHDFCLNEALSIREINQLGQVVDRYFSDLYQSIYNSIESVEVKEVFENLKQIQDKERITLSMATNSLWDM